MKLNPILMSKVIHTSTFNYEKSTLELDKQLGIQLQCKQVNILSLNVLVYIGNHLNKPLSIYKIQTHKRRHSDVSKGMFSVKQARWNWASIAFL